MQHYLQLPGRSTTHIPVLHVHKAALLQQEADGADVAACRRQMQRRRALRVEHVCVVVWVLQEQLAQPRHITRGGAGEDARVGAIQQLPARMGRGGEGVTCAT